MLYFLTVVNGISVTRQNRTATLSREPVLYRPGLLSNRKFPSSRCSARFQSHIPYYNRKRYTAQYRNWVGSRSKTADLTRVKTERSPPNIRPTESGGGCRMGLDALNVRHTISRKGECTRVPAVPQDPESS